MIQLIRNIVKSTVQGMLDEVKASDSRRLDDVMDELDKLKKLYVKTSSELAALQTIVKSVALNQAQIVADMHTVYVAAKGAGYLEELDHSDDSGDDGSDNDGGDRGGKGGMGGMIN